MSNFPDSVDVVVIGSGLAGHCAALAAAEAGATVALLEKTGRYGGSSITAGGSFAFSNTEAQRAAGIKDSDELFEQDLHKAANGKCDPQLIKTYLQHQHAAHAWLIERGVEFHKVSLSSSTSVPRTHPTNPKQLMAALHARVAATAGLSWWSGTAATRLLTRQDTRDVIGVTVVRDGMEKKLLAKRGVIITTGGFSRSPRFIEKFAPELSTAPAWGGEGNTGDGLIMGWALGADVLDTGYVTGTYGISINHYPDLKSRPGDEPYLRMANYRGAIVVNLDAKRFADESVSYKKLGTLTLAQTNAVAFQVFDQKIMDQSAVAPNINDFKGVLDLGMIRKADGLRALAATVGIDGATLEATVKNYNADVASGIDREFGRATLGGGFGKPVEIDTPPFYIFPCTTAVLSTYCGLRTDTEARVVNVFGEPIPGLYAAGEATGGFHGAGYVSGSALGKAAIFGRIAGRNAAGRG